MFGCHVNRESAVRRDIANNISAAVREARDGSGFSMKAAAIFVGGPKNRKITLTDQECADIRAMDTVVVAHNTYSASPWKGDPSAAEFIKEQLRTCQRAGIVGLVVHLPKLPADAVIRYLPRLHEPAAPDVKLYFETPAVSPKESYYETPAKLAALFRQIPPEMNVGLCIDTAHIWTCGVDISTYALAERYTVELEAMHGIIPPQSIMFHLNDSQRPLGVGPDAHEALTHGQIWAPGAGSGLIAFIDYIVKHNSIAILERKPASLLRSDYKIIKEIAYDSAVA